MKTTNNPTARKENMKTIKYYIKDYTQNTNREYISESEENVQQQRDAISFDSKHKADQWINEHFGMGFDQWGHIVAE